ncbi:Subtilisin-like protease SBT1.7 [Hibiscus syriacus]|uniref:Subtilisin-like protease SBT1.7 n=1 Tax=Hibiscus syriacus TaxID=106335 RepID=A0A6A2Y1L6_HIBSY|nr:Subtilisin-like protease SBT1.7 [Hibiscus syriacus]
MIQTKHCLPIPLMATTISIFFFLSLLFIPFSSSSSSSDRPQNFIIHVSKSHKPSLFSSHHHWYSSILYSLPPSPHPTKLIYSYQLAINGFSARLTASQAKKLQQLPGIISVIPDQIRYLHTTRTPHFLGLSDGMILANTAENGEELLSDAHLIPATMVGEAAGSKILEYIKTSQSPTATISFRGTVISPSPPSPKVAAFSSRGPHHLTPEILKPDVVAPGVNILAGWTGASAPTDLDIDPRRVDYNIISGTSMACPHVSGLAALLKKAYPNWSPAAIKSALMTTAYTLDNSGNTISDLATGEEASPFVYGAGHVDPNRALNPGLVEPTSSDVCESKFGTPGDLNYPSFSVVFHSSDHVVKYQRRVKNVGTSPDAVYVAKVNAPPGVEISVSPSKLEFSAVNQTLSYEIVFASNGLYLSGIASQAFGSIEWSNEVHLVRSPIAVRWLKGLQASI